MTAHLADYCMNVNASRGSTGYRGSVDFLGEEFICLVEQEDVKRVSE